jgi:RadC-like JAB domain-containing protein
VPATDFQGIRVFTWRTAGHTRRDQFARQESDAAQEEFHVVTLDVQLQVVGTHLISVGTLDRSLVHPREVFRPAIKDAAKSIILVYCFARTYDFREHAIKSMVGSSGRQRVQESCFDDYKVEVPTRSLLNLFRESAEPVFRMIKVLHSQNQKLRAARDLLLPRLMSGEVAV